MALVGVISNSFYYAPNCSAIFPRGLPRWSLQQTHAASKEYEHYESRARQTWTVATWDEIYRPVSNRKRCAFREGEAVVNRWRVSRYQIAQSPYLPDLLIL